MIRPANSDPLNLKYDTFSKRIKMKKLFSSLISITLVLSVLNFGQAHVVASNTSSSLPSAQARAARIRFAPRFIRGANRKLRYTIKAKYPQAVGASDARIQKLNQAIRDLIAGQVNEFKKDFQTLQERTWSSGSTFEADYSVLHSANEIVSVAFIIQTYFEGAAHGNYNSLVFNYDLNSGQLLKLADLFKPNSNYLKLISDYSIKALTKEFGTNADTEWIQRGAGASEENYKSWNITGKGLSVGFDPYQVASYAEGPHEVVIPYSVLKNVIDPAGPLARLTMKN
jgi:hypothetical protein